MAAWEKGGLLYGGLYGLGLLTALLTAIYTFRMVYIVFFGSGPSVHPSPRIMEWMLIPLAVLAIGGGLLNLPAYLGHGWLGKFLSATVGTEPATASHFTELALQGVAALVALVGLVVAHLRYGKGRDNAFAAAAQPAAGITAFLLNGWYVDNLYRFLFIRPYTAMSRMLWQRIDEGVIDDGLDRLAEGLGKTGIGLGRWTSGHVSSYILSFAAGGALILGYLAWVVW